MKVVKNIAVLSLLLVFLLGTTGLSVLQHFCNSSKEHNVTIYPEFFNGSGATCCESESIGCACGTHENSAGTSGGNNVDAVPCCKTTISFYRLEVNTLKPDFRVFGAELFQISVESCDFSSLRAPADPFRGAAHFQFYSPPLLSGKQLVLYLNQLRIPVQPSLA